MDEEPTEAPTRRYINDSDPNNPTFRHEVGGRTYQFTLRSIPLDTQSWLAEIVAAKFDEAYSCGKKDARAEIQTAIRNALML